MNQPLPESFRGLWVEEGKASDGTTSLNMREMPCASLPDGEVTIRVAYSSLNYKDAMACQGHRGVIQQLPHIPGIDAAGEVIASRSPEFNAGDKVLVTGYDLGQGTWGGWAELIRVPAHWVVRLPEGLNPRQAMILGTAGFTAAQCVQALLRNEIEPEAGEVVVTGATGGVGSLAVQILASLGFSVVAVTGKATEKNRLQQLGARQILSRQDILDDSGKPLRSARWAAAVDTVGGDMLGSLLPTLRYGGCVAACGLVAGAELHTTLYPFLLRGITLCGIASADCPRHRRLELWNRLSTDWMPPRLEHYVTESSLDALPGHVERILAGQATGRVIVNLDRS